MRIDGGLLLTDAVEVNGIRLGWFVVDTGAGLTTLDRDAAKRLALEPGRVLATIPGLPAPDGLYSIDSLSVGPLTIREHLIAVVDFKSIGSRGVPVAGVVGGDVFGSCPFTIDYEKKELTFYRRDSFSPPKGASADQLVFEGQLRYPPDRYKVANPHAACPTVRATVNGVSMRVLLDTGSRPAILLLPQAVAAHPDWADVTRVIGRGAGADSKLGGAEGVELVAARISTVSLLGARFRDPPGSMAAISGIDGDSVAIIGTGIFQCGRLTFDYARGRVWAQWRMPDRQ